jgi:S1/P1 Nuclease
MKKRLSLALLVAGVLAAIAPPVRAWDATGHEVIARIAWDAMKPETRAKAVALLEAAPPDADLASLLPPAGPKAGPQAVRERQLFELASTWPDIVRDKNVHPRYEKYHHGPWHYVNHFWEEGKNGPRDRTDLQPEPENVAERLHHFERTVGDPSRPAAERAVDLAWILHLAGDVHQPLHTSARVTPDAPQGDQGGNLVKITDQETLHWYWDQLVSKDFPKRAAESQEEYVERIARRLERRFPASSMRPRLGAGRYEDWVEEGYATSKSTVYRGVKPGREPSWWYRRRAFRTVEPRIALAGYRLAEILDRVLG